MTAAPRGATRAGSFRIDVHGHYTTAPPELDAYRGRQTGELNRPQMPPPRISDDRLRDSLQGNLRVMEERGIDAVLLSPRASGMGHDLGDGRVTGTGRCTRRSSCHRSRSASGTCTSTPRSTTRTRSPC